MNSVASAGGELPPFVSVPAAADYLNASRSFVVRAIARGELPSVQLEGLPHVPAAALVGLRARRDEEREAALQELAAFSQLQQGAVDAPYPGRADPDGG